MTAIVGVDNMYDFLIEVCCRNQHNKSKIALYKPVHTLTVGVLKRLYIGN